MFWSRKLIAKVATSIVAGDASRRGRNATRSIVIVSPITTAKQMRMLTAGL